MINGMDWNALLEEFEAFMGIGLLPMLLSEMPGALLSLAVYIVTGLGLYTIAKRRGIHNPWLAWVPFANMWLLGCISDHYRSVARGEVKHRRKVLLLTEIANAILAVAIVALCLVMLVNMLAVGFDNLDNPNSEVAQQLLEAVLGPVVTMLLLCLPMLVLRIVYIVFYIMALYDVFKSCDPSNATLYTVLSLLGNLILAVFLMLCRNKDDGMPAPVQQEPVYAVPQWQSMEPPVEPWQENHE